MRSLELAAPERSSAGTRIIARWKLSDRSGHVIRSYGCGVVAFLLLAACSAPSNEHGTIDTGASPQALIPTSSPEAPPAPPPGIQWDYSHDEDAMTSKVSHSASVASDNTVQFAFPYEGAQHGQLQIRRHPRFGNDIMFRIEKGQLLCPSYEGCSVLIRFDDGEPQSFGANAPADYSSETIFISNYERFLSKMRRAKKVRISPKIYQQGSVVFTFDVSGFDMEKFLGK